MYNMFYQSHAGSWAFLLLFFLAAYFLFRFGKPKASKIIYMIVRLFYIIMLVSGIGMLVFNLNASADIGNFVSGNISFLIKGLLAIMLIGIMEVIMGKTKRRETTGSLWIVFVVLMVAVVALGYLKLG
ncbi:DUF1516 family protein [Alkalicoccobacillus plakortidis]|uniref:DUF1516 family protein n=1 Tax=Alkalicoccobacillus plakortidis TaxID=444060 RepID=A0ABT0XHK6_9BACI|nr:DUF1516 family protein [Alkalicoccobacillus plakortidis]MCM2675393.1 DUF1516 family protein [Alkalicoccobacillus plakortidis]